MGTGRAAPDTALDSATSTRAVTMEVMALASKLRKGSIDRIMGMSDLELGLPALLGGPAGANPTRNIACNTLPCAFTRMGLLPLLAVAAPISGQTERGLGYATDGGSRAAAPAARADMGANA